MRLVAFEWDSSELRVALGRQKGKAVVIDEAFGIPFIEKEEAIKPAEIGKLLGKELQARGVTKGEALVAVGRANLELRFLTAPPAPADELPDLVRFQAMRQFTTLGDDWPLDFSPLGTTADGSTNVLATTISPETVTQIKSVAAAAGLNVSHLVLRPFAAASLLKQTQNDDRCRMTVDLLGTEADLSVMIGPNVVYPRTVRLPSADAPLEVRSRAILGEIRRTIVAAQNQLGGRRVEQIVIFGDERKFPELQAAWKNDLQMELKVLNPFTLVEVADSIRRTPPGTPGAFAPLLGLMADEAADQTHTIDFLQPRKRPPPKNYNRLYTIAGGSLAVCVAVLALLAFVQLWMLSSQADALDKQVKEQAKLAARGVPTIDRATRIEKFLESDVNWLDELDRLSQRFPTAEQARAEDLLALSKNTGGGNIIVQGLADDPDTITSMESALRDTDRTVIGSGSKKDTRVTDSLTWRYREEVIVHGPNGPPPLTPGRGATRTPVPRPATKGASK